jgi:ATP-binding cassette subfamily B protein
LNEESSNWIIIKRLLLLSWHYRAGCIKILALQSILLAMTLGGIGFAGLGIDVIRRATDPKAPVPHWPLQLAPPADWSTLEVITLVSGLVLLLAGLRTWLNYLYQVVLNEFVQGEIVVDLRAEVYEKLQRLSFRFYDANASTSLINRVTGDVQSVRMFVDQVLIQSIIMGISLAAYAVFMAGIHLGLTVVCLASTPLLWIASRAFSKIVQPAYAANRVLLDQLLQRLAENVRGIQVIKAFAGESEQIERFRKANDAVRDQQQWIFERVSIFTPLISFLGQVNLVVLLGYGGYLAAKGQVPIGTGLVAFAAILQQFAAQVGNMAGITDNMQQSLRGARRVFEVLDAPQEIVSPANPKVLGRARGEVEFRNVSFHHSDDPVLKDVSFRVEAGQRVAIVGPTGAGKSALISLLPRFYDPTSGQILMDGVDLRELDLRALRRTYGLVFQESSLFSISVADNIAFGNPEASRESIYQAAKIASAHDFILELPQGYDTVLGAGGAGLSGGQKQRLAIARALLLDPRILLLDDPTAAVDQTTEHDILTAMEAAMVGRTTFLVTHRPAALERADLIVVIDNGTIVQMGTHAELLNVPGYYADSARLHHAQASLPA